MFRQAQSFVYEKVSDGSLGSVKDILRTGNDIVAAGYCMYGAATELVMCFKAGKVERFALDPSLGEFVHTHSDVKIPADGGKKIYSCNEGNSPIGTMRLSRVSSILRRTSTRRAMWVRW